MDTQTPTYPDSDALPEAAARKSNRLLDGFNANTGKPTKQVGFRIYEEHAIKLKSEYFKDNSSLIIRMLLDEFFDGRVPSVDAKYQELLEVRNKQKEELAKII